MADKSKETLSKYIQERSRYKEKKLKYDFMPSLLEIIERPSHIASKVIVLSISTLLVIAIIWAGLSKIDMVVTGSGQILTDAGICAITAQTSGVVDEIFVSEGDYVNEGDTLVSFDSTELDMRIAQIESEIGYLKVQKDVLEKYLFDEETDILAENYDEKYKYVVNQLIYANELYKSQVEQQIYNEDLLLIQYQSNISEQLSVISEQLRVYEDELAAQKLLLEKTNVKSNTTGYIQNMSVEYKGQFVNNYENLINILPSESTLVFEGYLADKDLSDVNIGDKVVIKLQAYSFSDYGAIEGKISYISPTATSIEGVGNAYIIRVDIDVDTLHKEIELKSGLSGSVEINVGTRSILEYFLDPIIGNLNDSLKEK